MGGSLPSVGMQQHPAADSFTIHCETSRRRDSYYARGNGVTLADGL